MKPGYNKATATRNTQISTIHAWMPGIANHTIQYGKWLAAMNKQATRICMGLFALLAITACLAHTSVLAPIPAIASAPSTHGQLASSVSACGPNWTVAANPNLGSYDLSLLGVAAISSSDVWAVGSRSNGVGDYSTLAEHWDGNSWSVVHTADADSAYKELHAVAAVSSTSVWAVGVYESSSVLRTLTEHWDGAAWSIVPSPLLGTSDGWFISVAAISDTSVWAAGYRNDASGWHTLVEHWDGHLWNVVPGPEILGSKLFDINAITDNDVWAVGYYVNGVTAQPLVEHWNGSAWNIVSSPGVGTADNYLNTVAALSESNIWTAGYYKDGPIYRTLIEHWNGSFWSVVTSPNVGGDDNRLFALAAVSESDVWAVGDVSADILSRTLIEHWDGTAWSVVTSPNSGPTYNYLWGVAAVSGSDVWAVGEYEDTHSVFQRLIERYNPCSVSPTPTPPACPIEFTDVMPGSTFYSYVHCLACQGIIGGYTSDCTTGNPCFKPNDPITRGQLAKIVSISADYDEQHNDQTFQDVPLGSTFHDFIERLASRNIIGGYGCGAPEEPCIAPDNRPYFRPNNDVTRGQASKIVAIAAALPAPPPAQQTYQDVPPESTFWSWVEGLATAGTLTGYGCGAPEEPCIAPDNRPYFRPNNDVTRGQASKIVSHTFFPDCSSPQPNGK